MDLIPDDNVMTIQSQPYCVSVFTCAGLSPFITSRLANVMLWVSG